MGNRGRKEVSGGVRCDRVSGNEREEGRGTDREEGGKGCAEGWERRKGSRVDVTPSVKRTVEIEAKYKVYLERQEKDIALFKKSDAMRIPEGYDYEKLPISQEEKDKLETAKPGSIEEVKHILGIKPSTLLFIIKDLRKSYHS